MYKDTFESMVVHAERFAKIDQSEFKLNYYQATIAA